MKGIIVVTGASSGFVAFAVIDRVRDEMLYRVGMGDLLRPRGPARAQSNAS